MKHLILTLALWGLLLPLSDAAAQVPVEPDVPLVNEYVANTYAQRSSDWWSLLDRQLLATLDVPAATVDQTALQNVIYFATHHADKLALERAVPHLLDVYRTHPDERFRMMALSALYALGDEDGMTRLYRLLGREASERVRRMTVAVLNDYYAN